MDKENTPELLLYYKTTCPYCRKVLDFIDEQSIAVPLKDINATSDAKDELEHLGGKSQVPCLFIDGKALYESDEIIAWLKSYKKELDS
ncbi:MAG: glutaredoxin [Chlamydiia bacterium]|nr:glutaredoxin [Chlamydiia bacterium]MCP5491828.1 glutaredoxin [Chlamydiales bacterium]